MFNENGDEIKSDYDGSCDCEMFNMNYTENYKNRSELHTEIKNIFLKKNITKENIEKFIDDSDELCKLFGNIKIDKDINTNKSIFEANHNFKKASDFSQCPNEIKNFILNSICNKRNN